MRTNAAVRSPHAVHRRPLTVRLTTSEEPDLGRYVSVTPGKAAPSSLSAASFRGRIGRDARSGHYAVPRRYRLHLSLSCRHCLRIAITHSLLGLGDTLPVTLLPAVPDGPDGGHSALSLMYEASAHRYTGPTAAPVLSDDWSGRIVSTHTPDILRDLDHRFGAASPDRPVLHPCGTEGGDGDGRTPLRTRHRRRRPARRTAGHRRRGTRLRARDRVLRAGRAGAAARDPGPCPRRRTDRRRCAGVGDPGVARHRAPAPSGRLGGAPHHRSSARMGLRTQTGRPPGVRPPPRPRRHRPSAPCALPGPGGRRSRGADPGLGGAHTAQDPRRAQL
ncbi:LOW QUALITY PROTEIN: conserved hypothetical protein, partial [Streptomyces himastatinicus ATCC 53653]